MLQPGRRRPGQLGLPHLCLTGQRPPGPQGMEAECTKGGKAMTDSEFGSTSERNREGRAGGNQVRCTMWATEEISPEPECEIRLHRSAAAL